MGSKNEPGNFDCYANALPDEPMFILLGRDPSAPDLVDRWADERHVAIMKRERSAADLGMVKEARECANKMREWRKDNDGKWRR